jgi:hypothetical protein
MDATTKLSEYILNSDYFKINEFDQLLPVFELKGVKTNNGLSIDATTKLLGYKINSDYYNINASNQLSPVFELKE